MHQRKTPNSKKVPESHGNQLVQIEKIKLKIMEELILSRKHLQVEQSIDMNLQKLVRHLQLSPLPSLQSAFRSTEQSPFTTQSPLATPINNGSQSPLPSPQSAFRQTCARPQSPLTPSINNDP